MSQTGLRPPPPLSLEGNIALNWHMWYAAYKLYTGAAGLVSKSEKVQCCTFLYAVSPVAQKVHHTIKFETRERDKIKPLVEAFA